MNRCWNQKTAAILLAFACLLAGCNKSKGEIVTPGGTTDAAGSYRPAVPDVSAEMEKAIEKNSDVVGWLMIPNTTIDEAVVQAKDNEYYLRRDVQKNYAFEGCYFLDYESVMFDDGADLAQNSIIYGHNLGNPTGVKDDPEGVKFAQLFKLEDEGTARKTPYIYFVTPGAEHVFEIFAAYYCEAFTKPIPYHLVDYSPEDLVTLAEDAKARSHFLYDVEIKPGDKLLTLSTCTYRFGTYSQNSKQRYVVMARLVQPGESYHEEAKVTKNPQPKEPDFS